jgi:hypothetical protein
MDDDFDGPDAWQLQEMHREQEEMALAALARCGSAGASEDDLRLIAAILGLGSEYQRVQDESSELGLAGGRTDSLRHRSSVTGRTTTLD